jgi:hypothetical protein
VTRIGVVAVLSVLACATSDGVRHKTQRTATLDRFDPAAWGATWERAAAVLAERGYELQRQDVTTGVIETGLRSGRFGKCGAVNQLQCPARDRARVTLGRDGTVRVDVIREIYGEGSAAINVPRLAIAPVVSRGGWFVPRDHENIVDAEIEQAVIAAAILGKSTPAVAAPRGATRCATSDDCRDDFNCRSGYCVPKRPGR